MYFTHRVYGDLNILNEKIREKSNNNSKQPCNEFCGVSRLGKPIASYLCVHLSESKYAF